MKITRYKPKNCYEVRIRCFIEEENLNVSVIAF